MRPHQEDGTRSLLNILVWHPVDADVAEEAGAATAIRTDHVCSHEMSAISRCSRTCTHRIESSIDPAVQRGQNHDDFHQVVMATRWLETWVDRGQHTAPFVAHHTADRGGIRPLRVVPLRLCRAVRALPSTLLDNGQE